MKTVLLNIVTASAVVLSVTTALNAQILPVGEPGTELFYQRLLHLRTAGDNAITNYQLAPYLTTSASNNTPGALSYWPQSQNAMRVYVSPSQGYDGEQQRRSVTTERFRAGVTAHLSDNISAMSSFVLDEELARDPTYTGKVWRGLAGDVETALVSYQNNKLTALAGRYRASWGPQYTNLLLSQTAAPLDGASFRYRFGSKLTFSYQIARLDPISPDTDSSEVFINRYLAAHRVDLRFSDNVRIGIFESALFAGPGRGMELQFLNPLMFFHGNQLNEDNNDNTFLGLDYDLRLMHNLNLFGQFLVDDFQIDNKTQGDQEPNEIGFIFGARLNDILPATDLKVNWSRVTNRTYNQKLPRNRYLNQNRPLGHPLGNDFETIQLDFLHWFGAESLLRLTSIIQRRGVGRITDPWSEPWLATSGDFSEPFPTGTVEKSTAFELGYLAKVPLLSGSGLGIGREGLLQATLGWRDFKNERNLQNSNRSSFYLRMNFSLFLAGDIKLN